MSVSEQLLFTPPEIAENTVSDLLPNKSRPQYEKQYGKFNEWCDKNDITVVSETVLLDYFELQCKKYKPTSLYTTYSMLKSCLSIYRDVDISKYEKLQTFLKEKSQGYAPKKSKILEEEDINKFIRDADDKFYLAMKIVLIMGYSGALSRQELTDMSIDDIEYGSDSIIVSLSKTKNDIPKIFAITDTHWIDLIKKYTNLRPNNVKHKRFFLTFRNGHCINSPIGINIMGRISKDIAKFLKFPNYKLYTGHCFRRSSAKHLATHGIDLLTIKNYGVRNSSAVPEGYVDASLRGVWDNGSKNSTLRKNLQNLEPEYVDCQREAVATMNTSLPQLQSIQGPSTGAPSHVEKCSVKRKDPLTEDCEEYYGGGSGEAVDTTIDALDMINSQILLDEVEPLRGEGKSQNLMPEQCDLFGEYIAKHLQQLPLDVAIKLQLGIQTLVTETRLEYIRKHPAEAPSMVKQEAPAEEDELIQTPSTETPTNQPASVNPVQSRAAKRPRMTDSSEAKRLKLNNSETQNSNSSTTHTQQKRTECTIFAKHIALQLEQFPEEMSLQLQVDIYQLITHALPHSVDEDAPDLVEIKDEIIEFTPTEITNLLPK